MRIGRWHPEPGTPAPAYEAHLHGRNLEVVAEPTHRGWNWFVRSPRGALLADGIAATMEGAEEAAEDEATAVHPPTGELLERLLG